MKIRGNNLLFFGVELSAGILVFIFTLLWGDIGFLGLILFFSGLILVRSKSIPDEREINLIFKASSLELVVLGAVMAIIYLKFPNYNWFHGFISFGMISRGLIGMILFFK